MARTYDPAGINIIFAGNIITGIAPGTFIRVERNADMWGLQIGSAGEGARIKSNDKSGKITLTLMQTSPSNDILSAQALIDEQTNGGSSAAEVRDSNGTSLHAAENAWVKKTPDSEYSNEGGTREWVLETENLVNFVGSND